MHHASCRGIECAVEVMRVKYAIVGGDARLARLCEALNEDGHRVRCFALEKAELTGDIVKTGCLQGCVYGADCVILPIPAENAGVLNTPLSDNALRMSDVVGALWQGQVLIGGRFGDNSCALAQKSGVHIEDLMQRAEFVMGNAALTAECALARMMQESDRALMMSTVLVCGWGRIGKVLALRLAALGADVTVAARAHADRAEAQALGIKAVGYKALEAEIGGFDFIVNTVPARVLTDAMLCMAADGAVIMELASPPGGFDRALAENIGLHVVHAPGLPGVLATRSAAALIKENIYDVMRELEERE